MNQIRKNIMHRVYYAYILRRMKHPLVSHGIILMLAFVMFSNVVSIPDVWKNMMEIKVGDILVYLGNALMNTDSLTISLMVLMMVTVISMFWKTLRDSSDSLSGDEGGWALR